MKLIDTSLAQRITILRGNTYFTDLPEPLLSEQQAEQQPPHFTQEQLAAQLGTVREVVARSLKELERSGAIRIDDRRIRVADNDVLQQWTNPNLK